MNKTKKIKHSLNLKKICSSIEISFRKNIEEKIDLINQYGREKEYENNKNPKLNYNKRMKLNVNNINKNKNPKLIFDEVYNKIISFLLDKDDDLDGSNLEIDKHQIFVNVIDDLLSEINYEHLVETFRILEQFKFNLYQIIIKNNRKDLQLQFLKSLNIFFERIPNQIHSNLNLKWKINIFLLPFLKNADLFTINNNISTNSQSNFTLSHFLDNLDLKNNNPIKLISSLNELYFNKITKINKICYFKKIFSLISNVLSYSESIISKLINKNNKNNENNEISLISTKEMLLYGSNDFITITESKEFIFTQILKCLVIIERIKIVSENINEFNDIKNSLKILKKRCQNIFNLNKLKNSNENYKENILRIVKRGLNLDLNDVLNNENISLESDEKKSVIVNNSFNNKLNNSQKDYQQQTIDEHLFRKWPLKTPKDLISCGNLVLEELFKHKNNKFDLCKNQLEKSFRSSKNYFNPNTIDYSFLFKNYQIPSYLPNYKDKIKQITDIMKEEKSEESVPEIMRFRLFRLLRRKSFESFQSARGSLQFFSTK